MDTAASTTQTGPNITQLGLPFSLYIECPQLTQGMSSSQVNDRCTFVIPINGNAGDILYYSDGNSYEQWYTYASPLTLFDLNVRVRTRDGTTVNLNGADWQFHLLLE